MPKRASKSEATDVELVGMQRWVCNVIEQGVPVRYLILACHLGMTLWAIFALAAIFFSFHWILWLPLLAILAAVCTLYILVVRSGYEVARNPEAELEWYQQLFWDGLLAIARMRNWADTNRSPADVLDLRDEHVSDQQLVTHPGLKGCQVLDLEGCPVTDACLKSLRGIKPLQCLVVRETEISHPAIVQLQQKNPTIWIWY